LSWKEFWVSSQDNPQIEPKLPLSSEPSSSFPRSPDDHPFSLSDAGLGQNSPLAQPSGENPAWNGWDVLAIIGLAFVTIFISQFVILFGAHYLVYPRVPVADLAQRPILILIMQFGIDGAVGLYLFLWVEGKYRVPFWKAIRWNWPGGWWKLLGVGAATLLGLGMLERILPMPKDTPFDKLFSSPRDAYLIALMAVSLGPLVEELFFRGMFYPVLAKRWGAEWGVLVTALLFGLMHLPQYGNAWGPLVVIFAVGVVCGTVRAATGSVAASFLVHVGYNGTQMLIAILITHGFTQMPKSLLEWNGV